MRMEGKRLPEKVLYCYVDGNRRRGRQTRTGMENVRQNLAEKDTDLRTGLNRPTIRYMVTWSYLVKTLPSVNT